MQKLARILWGIAWPTFLFFAVVGAGLWWMNRPQGWDARKALATQDAKLEGKVGVVIVALAMPETYDPVFFENFLDKLFTNAIPWPINVFAGADAGTALLDPENPLATERFAPKQLADIWGRTSDIDGIPWAEKYRRGQVRFVKPSGTVAHDHGFFLYPARKGGVRTATAKTMLKARYIMYAALPNGYLPHFSQTMALGDQALKQLNARHPIAASAVVDAFDPWQEQNAVWSVLDKGVDTLVIASVQPILSDFEELRGSYPKIEHAVEAWRARNGNKPIKLVIAPSMSGQTSFDDLWVQHLVETAPTATAGRDSVRVIVALHGLPVSIAKTDSWSTRYPAIIARLKPKLAEVMKAKGYRKIVISYGFEAFSSAVEDPKNQLISVSEEIEKARANKDSLAIIVPVEFMAENTDTLFTHAAAMFEGLPGYTAYMGPPVSTEWDKPYVRQFQAGGTRIIHTGTPGASGAVTGGKALADAISTLWK